MNIMLNPILADEPPTLVDKMESIFMKNDQVINVKTLNIDEKEITKTINQPTDTTENVEVKNVFDERDFIALGTTEKPAGFSITSDTPEQTTDWIF